MRFQLEKMKRFLGKESKKKYASEEFALWGCTNLENKLNTPSLSNSHSFVKSFNYPSKNVRQGQLQLLQGEIPRKCTNFRVNPATALFEYCNYNKKNCKNKIHLFKWKYRQII